MAAELLEPDFDGEAALLLGAFLVAFLAVFLELAARLFFFGGGPSATPFEEPLLGDLMSQDQIRKDLSSNT